MLNALWLILPDDLVPLLGFGLAIGVLVGLIRLSRALLIVAATLLLAAGAPTIEQIIASVPWWFGIAVSVLVGAAILRTFLEALIGREAAGRVLATAFLGVMRAGFRTTVAPLRFAFRAIRARRRDATDPSIASLRHLGLMLAIAVPLVACGRVERAVARGATRSVKAAISARVGKVMARDRRRDAWLPVSRLTSPRALYRYTTAARATAEARRGLQAGTHMSAVPAARGRPLAAATAQRRYGLPQRPDVRETVVLPAGTPVRRGKVLGGAPGVGELTNARPVPPSAVRKVVPLQAGPLREP